MHQPRRTTAAKPTADSCGGRGDLGCMHATYTAHMRPHISGLLGCVLARIHGAKVAAQHSSLRRGSRSFATNNPCLLTLPTSLHPASMIAMNWTCNWAGAVRELRSNGAWQSYAATWAAQLVAVDFYMGSAAGTPCQAFRGDLLIMRQKPSTSQASGESKAKACWMVDGGMEWGGGGSLTPRPAPGEGPAICFVLQLRIQPLNPSILLYLLRGW